MELGEILASLKGSAKFFINFYLGEDLTYDVPEFHEITWAYLIAVLIPKIALALPRAHAKTTLAKLAVVWYLCFTPVRFVVYLSNTSAVATEACQDIVNFLEDLNHQQVFGVCNFQVRQEGRGFYKFTMNWWDGVRFVEKFVVLKAFGAGQQVRGLNIDNRRPELAVVDDLEDDDNTATPALILKLWKWFYGPFYKALAKPNKVIFLGNMLSAKSLLHHFCTKSEDWHSLRFGCLKSDHTPLWPDLWPMEAIRKDFIEYQLAGLTGRWFAEMMNLPIADGNLLINAEDIYYVPELNPGEQEMAFITVDPAISLKEWADNTAIVVHVYKAGIWRIAEYVVGRMTPDQIFWYLVQLSQKWNTRVVGIEQAAFQKALKILFEVLMTIHRVHFEIYEVPHNNRPKHERIAQWCAFIRKKLWALQEGEFSVTEQLLMYDPAKPENDDDLIDACSMGIAMTEMYMAEIVNSYTIAEQLTHRTGYELCQI